MHDAPEKQGGMGLRSPLGRRECRLIFRNMAKAEINGAAWGPGRRRRLLKFSQRLGLNLEEAVGIVREVENDLRPQVDSDRRLVPLMCILAGMIVLNLWLVAYLL